MSRTINESQLGWVDFSSTDREKVSKILAMLREPGTLDELGIGQIRDAFADLLFPGFSTIQTRAKYLITVPRILQDYHHFKIHKSIDKYLAEKENEVAVNLDKNHDGSVTGIIGRTMVKDEKGVARKPSSVYWNGFREFGIIHTTMSLNEFLKRYEDIEQHKVIYEDIDNIQNEYKDLINTPAYEDCWIEDVTLDLSKEEADFLYGKMTTQKHLVDTIPVQLFINNLMKEALDLYELADEIESLDLLQNLMDRSDEVSTECKNILRQANEFSLAMQGAHLRYYLLLASKKNYENSALIEKYTLLFNKWREEVNSKGLFTEDCKLRWISAASIGRKGSFNGEQFVEGWAEAIRNNSPSKVLDGLIIKQVNWNKKARSPFRKNIQLENYIKVNRLSYRWSTVKIILQDIVDGRDNA